MPSLTNAALFGIAAGDRSLFAPVAAPTAPYGQLAYGSAPAYSAPAAASAYAMPGAEAFAQEFVQPVEYVSVAEPQSDNSQFWLWTGAGALAVLGAAAARRETSAVADLDETDLESARIATLGVGGSQLDGQTGKPAKDEKWTLATFLMGGRRSRDGKLEYELELLSGATRTPIDDPSELNKRFKIGYDTRSRAGPKKVAKRAGGPSKGVVTWRSQNPTTSLFPGKKK